MVPEHHLGEILMEFLDLYGNQFNYEHTAIQLNPPGYIPKVHYLDFCLSKKKKKTNPLLGSCEYSVQEKARHHRSQQSKQ